MTSGGDHLDRQLQPHLTAAHRGHHAPSPGLDNPALALDDEAVRVDMGGLTGAVTASSPATWERFDDDDDNNNNNEAVSGAPGTQTQSAAGTKPPPQHAAVSGSAGSGPGSEMNGKVPPGPSSHAVSSTAPQQTTTTTTVEHPVVYNCLSGEAVVVPGNVTSASGSGGSVIATQHIPERWRELERPLRARQMKILKVLSVVSAVLFFPTGIPAVYFAWRTRREFDEGILRGNIDRAQKYARRTERLIILSAILVVLTAVLAFALVEREAHDYKVDHSYVAHASVNG